MDGMLTVLLSGMTALTLLAVRQPARVTAHTVGEGDAERTVFLIKFDPEVMARDAAA